MKKNKNVGILLTSLLLTTFAYAQPVKTSGTGAAYTTVTNAGGESQTVLTIGPRLAIQSPWWINNMVNAAKDDVQQANKAKDSAKIDKNKEPVEVAEIKEPKELEKVKEIEPIKNVNINVPNNNVQNKIVKSSNQNIKKNVVIKTNDIAGFNTTSLDEMTIIGQKQTEEAYFSHVK